MSTARRHTYDVPSFAKGSLAQVGSEDPGADGRLPGRSYLV